MAGRGANGGSAEARGGGVLYYQKLMDSLFLCGGLVGDCVWWLVTVSDGLVVLHRGRRREKNQCRRVDDQRRDGGTSL